MKYILTICLLFFSVGVSLATIIGPFGKQAGQSMVITGTVLPDDYKDKINTKVEGYLVKVEKVDGKIPQKEVSLGIEIIYEIVPPQNKTPFLLKEGEKFTCRGYWSTGPRFMQKINEGTPPKTIYFIQFFQCIEILNTEQSAAPDAQKNARP